MAEKLGIDLIWFGVLLGVNMQTSFMHPPFGFALFYLRSVAPQNDYTDRVTKKLIAPVTTMQIYWGAVPFVLIQVVMVGLIMPSPVLSPSGLDKEKKIDVDKVQADGCESHAKRREPFTCQGAGSAPSRTPATPQQSDGEQTR